MKTPFSTGNRYFLTTPPYVSKSLGNVWANVWANVGANVGARACSWIKINVTPVGINIFNIWGYFGANWGFKRVNLGAKKGT